MLRFEQFGWRTGALYQVHSSRDLIERVGQVRLDAGDGEAEVARDQRVVERLDMIEEEDVSRVLAEAA
jgi:hypothetical protein